MAKKRSKKKTTAKLRFDQIALIGATALLLLFYPGGNRYAYSQDAVYENAIAEDPLPGFNPAPYPFRNHRYDVPQVSARAVYIFDPLAGVVLYEKNAEQKLAPASTAKLMTAIVAEEAYDLTQVLTVKKLVNDGKNMGLFYGEKMSVENLLYGALVDSANDAAFVLADNYVGGVKAFVARMNIKAVELGLKNTQFANSVGYDNPGQFISARDLALLSAYVLQKPILAHMVGTKAITVADASFSHFHRLQNVNELLGELAGVAGIKTGFTPQAGENLASLVKKEDKAVIIIVLGSKDRFGETRNLIDWVFGEFSWKPIIVSIQDGQRIHTLQNRDPR